MDYFRWRHEDAHRNALSAHCYWRLRSEGISARDATRELDGLGVSDKNELLFQRGINFNDLPAWHRRGVGLYWETYEKAGRNPKSGEASSVVRRRIKVDAELPMGDEYGEFVRNLMVDDANG